MSPEEILTAPISEELFRFLKEEKAKQERLKSMERFIAQLQAVGVLDSNANIENTTFTELKTAMNKLELL